MESAKVSRTPTKEKKKKKRKRTWPASPVGGLTAAAAAASSSSAADRNWSDLPGDALLLILDLLPFFADPFAFASVCRSWRSIARSPSARLPLSSRPPLLLFPVGSCSCRLRNPTDDIQGFRFYRSMLSSETLRVGYCLGYSHGHLIFSVRRQPFLADVFSGKENGLPKLPYSDYSNYRGILTAPVSSPECKLLLFRPNSLSLLSWRPGGCRWSEEWLDTAIPDIRCLVGFQGRIFGMEYHGRLLVLEFSQQVSLEILRVEFAGEGVAQLILPYGYFGQHLVECGGQLLLVCFVQSDEIMFAGVNVYRLDFLEPEWKWVKVDSLGDWCLFIDHMGCSFSCRNPSRWGGRSNCIYIVGPGCDAWSVVPLDGTLIDTTTTESPLCPSHSKVLQWPSSMWVYPSVLL